ncbi:hypothetical protein G7Y89_g7876 [Cudoniella acicularis]|uniref:Ergothioneine biosynthesis protein 1 n=1 Tax=Cudoniella acicularis TaxID=354080 RepID=A0A8H4RJY8_9HELO|nr:hypothetical protein G7Y89_g7876 [Cudoniella acicularis]
MTIPSASSDAVDYVVEGKEAQNSGPSGSLENGKLTNVPNVDIIDIRQDAVEINLKEEILDNLRPLKGIKKLPTLLLYNDRGLQLFEEITYLDEYYLTNAEIDVLERSADSIARAIPTGSMVIELGSGNLRKVSILLRALEAASKDVDYYALDLSKKELERTLEQVPHFKYVKCHGLHGTYDDGLDWLQMPENISRTKCVMSLGSSIGNFHRHEAAGFLRRFAEGLQSSDSMLIGLDATSDPGRVYHAYNDREGLTHKFILNGLVHANKILGEQAFNPEDWNIIGEYVFDGEGGRHQAFVSPKRNVHYRGIRFMEEERIQIEQSLKYSPEETSKLWKNSGLREVDRWAASSDAYNIHFLAKDVMAFDSSPTAYAASTVPTWDDWQGLWKVWDLVTRRMIPDENLLEKPIKLRNACIFYLGHIPTFLDIQLNKVTSELPCEPSYYPKIFERGIDPDVDNPEHCHAHSEIPDQYPPLEEILEYQSAVRRKVEKLYALKAIPRDMGRALWIGLEHEIMHLETLLYMLLQSDKTRPPSTYTPDFEGDAKLAEAARVSNEWFDIPEQKFTIGLNDPEDNTGGDLHFGWDNEKPPRDIVVPAFQAQGRPITNQEYARYLEQTHNPKIPASWADSNTTSLPTNGYFNGHSVGRSNGTTNGFEDPSTPLTKAYLEGKSVRTVYGLVPLKYALDWPVFASYDELAGCAKWMGGRIPTVEEARSIYRHVESLKSKEVEQHLGKTVPAVNGHLINNGVEESPPSTALTQGGSSQELFTDLHSANIGFKHWHPVAVTANGNKLAGQAELGGVWEWTSSILEKHEGFEPGRLYPAYTVDFFDGKHNIVLGGSWATHPRIAGRKTLSIRACPDIANHYIKAAIALLLVAMNWATIAPESRLYKGKNLFRWENTIAVFAQLRYTMPEQKQLALENMLSLATGSINNYTLSVSRMNVLGQCNSSDEMHHNRHKEILKIMRQISSLDTVSDIPISKFTPNSNSNKTRRESTATLTSTPTDTSSETFSIDYSKQTRRERKRAKKTGIGVAKEKKRVEAFPQEELDFVSEAIHLAVHESKGAWEGSYNYDNHHAAAEDVKSLDLEDVSPEEDQVEAIIEHSSILNLSARGANEMTPRQRKVVRTYNTPVNHSSFGGGSRKYVPNKKSDIYDGVDQQIFFRLGIEVTNPPHNSKARKELVVKLVAAIKDDLDVIDREDRESAMREEGFWRWAGKSAYQKISQVREDIDWATGQKKGGTPRREYLADDELTVTAESESTEADETPIDGLGGPVKPPQVERTFKSKVESMKEDAMRIASPGRLIDADEKEEDEDEEDETEMLLRYKQRLAGKRNIGRRSTGHAKGMVLRLV